MPLYNAFLSSTDDVVTAAHMREDLAILDFRMSCDSDAGGTGSGSAWSVEIEIPNPGWAFLGTGDSKYVAFLFSDDGTFANATVLAKGRILPLEGECNSQTIKVKVVCAPADIQGLIFAYCNTNLSAEPYADRLFEDFDFLNPQCYLEARSSTLTIHPVTHAVGITDICVGERTVDLGTLYDWNSVSMVSLQPPYARARLTVTAEWEQHISGNCNIAGFFSASGVVTCNPNFMETADRGFPGSLVNFNLGQGWTLERTTLVCTVQASAPFYTGRLFTHQTQDRNLTIPGPGVTFYPNYYSDIHSEQMAFNVFGFKPSEVWMRYDYNQPRREIATILVGIDLQDVTGICAEKDLGGVSLNDLFMNYYPNPTPPPEPDQYGNYIIPYTPFLQVQPWSFETEYNTGDIIDFQGQYYRALRPTSGYFYKLNPNASWQNPQPGVYVLEGYTTLDWVAVPSNAAIPDYRQPNFFDSDRGKKALQHAALRVRAFLRKSMLSREVTLEFRWEDAIQVGMHDSVRVVLYAAGVLQPVVGKVKSIERHWGWDGRTVKIKLAVPLGTGRDDVAVNDANANVYAEDYFADEYVAGDSTIGSYAVDDLQYALAASPLVVPVDAFQLGDPLYSVFGVTTQNEAGYQLAQAFLYASQLRDPRDAVADYPTYLEVTMRPIQSTGVIQRTVDLAGSLTVSPRGLDLSTPGGEP